MFRTRLLSARTPGNTIVDFLHDFCEMIRHSISLIVFCGFSIGLINDSLWYTSTRVYPGCDPCGRPRRPEIASLLSLRQTSLCYSFSGLLFPLFLRALCLVSAHNSIKKSSGAAMAIHRTSGRRIVPIIMIHCEAGSLHGCSCPVWAYSKRRRPVVWYDQ